MGAEFRELLLADLALAHGVANARDVAAALQRFWEERAKGATFETELAHAARLEPERLRPLIEEADRLVGGAGGDAKLALMRRGGLDRSVHLAADPKLTRALTGLGAKAKAPLRPLPPDRYAAFETVGEGGMGVVYLALDTELNRRVALKMVKPSPQAPHTSPVEAKADATEAFENLKTRFLQEAWVTGGLEHPGIVPVYELGQNAAGVPYYTMRYVRGQRTLAHAIREGHGIGLLEPFLKLCDTVRYAHSRDVIHRDLKPANVALGEFGEVVLLDWGLAKMAGKEDLTGTVWQRKISEFRQATDMRTVEGALGTPGYMAPEAALGLVDEVDKRSDVYSLGAILFEILTGRLPFQFTTYVEFVRQVTQQDAPPARSIDDSVPRALSDLCARALSREPSARPEGAEALANEVRAWQAQSAIDREVEGLRRDAAAALDAAEAVHGEARLRQIDRAVAALAQLERRGAEGGPLRERAVALREQGILERERASGRRLLRRVAAAALVLATVAGFVVAAAIQSKRQEAEEARGETLRALGDVSRERDAKAAALAEVLRLADSKKVANLLAEADRLWPVHPGRAPAMAAWIERAAAVAANRKGHEEALARVRERALPYTEEQRLLDHAETMAQLDAAREQLPRMRAMIAPAMDAQARQALDERLAAVEGAVRGLEEKIQRRASWSFDSPDDDWRNQVLGDLVAGLEKLGQTLEAVTRRRETAEGLGERSIGAYRRAWDETIAAIALSPRYGGLEISPQLGLVPLGPDPGSGLFEFGHVGSGEMPARNARTGKLGLSENSAIVLVLIPGGRFLMRAQSAHPDGPGYDPWSTDPNEGAVHGVALSPYFLAKHECTQAQWESLTGGTRPSTYRAGHVIPGLPGRAVTRRNPVEQISWEECAQWLPRWGLALPTEAQWEYACRAGTQTPWSTGVDPAGLSDAANVAGAFCKAHGGSPSWPYSEEVDDGYVLHAPVGSLRPNPFGLHDMHGNVWEWCRDMSLRYAREAVVDPVVEGPGNRVFRGGSWAAHAPNSRSATRSQNTATFR